MDYVKREKIILDNLKLVKAVVNRHFYDTVYDDEDLIMVGVIGLINAVDTYDKFKKYKFSSYAYRCIYNEIASMIKIDWRHNIYDKSISYDDEDYDYVKDTITDGIDIEEIYFSKEEKIVINKLLDKLNISNRDIEIGKKYYGFYNREYSQTELAKMYNMSHTNVQNILKKFLRELTKLILKEYGTDCISTKQKEEVLYPKVYSRI